MGQFASYDREQLRVSLVPRFWWCITRGGGALCSQGGEREGGYLTRTAGQSPVMSIISAQVLCPYLQFVGIPEIWQRGPPPRWVEGCDPGQRPMAGPVSFSLERPV